MFHLIKSSKAKRLTLLSTVLCTAIGGSFTASLAQAQSDGVSQKSNALTVRGSYGGLLHAQAVMSYYDGRSHGFFWSDAKSTHQLMALLEEGWTHGFNTERYHISMLRSDNLSRSAREKFLTDASFTLPLKSYA